MTATERKIALITGASRGIGAAIVRQLAAQGHRVTILGRSLPAAQTLAALDPAHLQAVAADVADAGQVAAALAKARARFGPIGLLVNNAGQAESVPFLKMEAVLWQRMLDVNQPPPRNATR